MRTFSMFGLGLIAAAGLIVSSSAAFAAGDAAKGATAFGKCKACHSTDAGKNMVGPSLAGVVGRASGSIANYAYSAGMKGLNVSWTEENLDKWLTSPKAMVAGTKMTFPGVPSAEERADIIAFLKTK